MAEIEFTKLSSKGQIVIPRSIRETLRLKTGMPFAIMEQRDAILLKKMEMPNIKSWNESTKPFRKAAKKSKFSKEDLSKIIKEVRK